MPSISAVIITLNEEKNIERCILSLQRVADEIVVVDSYSEDMTADICSRMGVKFYLHPFEGYREQKNYAMSLASNDWILSLDADEALSEEMEESILKEKSSMEHDGYLFNRLNRYCGTWIKHSNWYPDRKLRLFRRDMGEWKGINPHDHFVLNSGSHSKRLKGDILHFALDTYEEHIEKANNFSSIAAREYYLRGKKTNPASMIIRMVWRFVKAFFLKRGFMDGYNGFVISSLSAYTSFLKYLKLRQLYLEENGRLNRNNIDVSIAGVKKDNIKETEKS
ncbi:MAG: glycosyltransferase family 2 protein [Bacteroidales bacterium]|nr:glycosyltransferase family 2 protein [Bacteroidales bacterium]